MNNQSKQQPERLTPYTEPIGCGHINYLVEQIEKDGEQWYQYQSAQYASLDRGHVIEAIIRDKYTQSQVEAITQNHMSGDNHDEFIDLQRWRRIAKLVADGVFMKSDIEQQLASYDFASKIDNVITSLTDKGILP